MRHLTGAAVTFATMLGVFLLFPLAPCGQAIAQSESPRRYTHHAPATGAPRIIALAVEGPFTPEQRSNVLRAIEEWNHALNGFIRFDIVSHGSGGPEAWSIRVERGGSPDAPNPVAGQPLSLTQAGFLGIGGRMVIYIDHVGWRDLRGIVLHEMGGIL